MNMQYSFGSISTKDQSDVRSESGPSTSFVMESFVKQCGGLEPQFDMDKFMARRQELIDTEK